MTYPEVAEQLSVRVCWGDDCTVERIEGRSRAHQDGWCDLSGKVHWRDRRVNRWGLYRFLKLVVTSKLGLQPVRGGPYRTWAMASGAFDLGLEVGVRFSRKILAEDRTLVRSWLAAGYGQDMDDDTRRKVSRWAR